MRREEQGRTPLKGEVSRKGKHVDQPTYLVTLLLCNLSDLLIFVILR